MFHDVGNKDTAGIFVKRGDIGRGQEVDHSSSVKYFDIKSSRRFLLCLLC